MTVSQKPKMGLNLDGLTSFASASLFRDFMRRSRIVWMGDNYNFGEAPAGTVDANGWVTGFDPAVVNPKVYYLCFEGERYFPNTDYLIAYEGQADVKPALVTTTNLVQTTGKTTFTIPSNNTDSIFAVEVSNINSSDPPKNIQLYCKDTSRNGSSTAGWDYFSGGQGSVKYDVEIRAWYLVSGSTFAEQIYNKTVWGSIKGLKVDTLTSSTSPQNGQDCYIRCHGDGSLGSPTTDFTDVFVASIPASGGTINSSLVYWTIKSVVRNDTLADTAGNLPSYEQTNPFYQDYISALTGFGGQSTGVKSLGMIRYMDLLRTNDSPHVSWSNRAKNEQFSLNNSKGIPIEWVARLSNRLNTHAYVCVPHQADDNYVSQMATLIKAELNSDLGIYVELSNEWWNGIFSQGGYFHDQGITQNLYTGDGSSNDFSAQIFAYAKRMAEVFDLFRAVWSGTDADRCKFVVGNQGTIQAFASDILNYTVNSVQNKDRVSYIAHAPYFGGWTVTGDPTEVAKISNYSCGDIYNKCLDDLAYFAAEYSSFKSFLNTNYPGIIPIAYEGGSHFTTAYHGSNVDSNFEKYKHFQESPFMKALYEKYLSEFYTGNGTGTIFLHFNFISKWSKDGYWGLNQKLGDLPTYRYGEVAAYCDPAYNRAF